MRCGRTVQADILTRDIGERIAKARAKLLSKATLRDTKQLWSLVRGSSTVPSARHASAQINLTADDLNLHYSKVATDSEYDAAEIENVLKSMPDNSESDKFTPYSADLFAIILSKLNSTSPGPDGIPFWLYKTCSAQLSLVMSKLVNFSISKGVAHGAHHPNS